MEIYDRAGVLIGYVRQSDVSQKPLENTHQVGDRKREQWLQDLAYRSFSGRWSPTQIKLCVSEEVDSSPHLSTNNSRSGARSEGLLAASAIVRGEFDRLRSIRDEAWDSEKDFLRRVKHGPHQLLVDILRRQANGTERANVQSAVTYLAFMHRQYGAWPTKLKNAKS